MTTDGHEVTNSVIDRARAVAKEQAGPAADVVDRDSRFPYEAVNGLREMSLLSAMLPVELGGEGATLSDIGLVVETLAKECPSTALIYAMHQVQVACLSRHGRGVGGVDALLRNLVTDQWLLASATSETGSGGDMRTSRCAISYEGNGFTLEKHAPVISYGEHADAILATARRSAASPPNDQVLVVCRRSTTQLERAGDWRVLGLRGTCGPPFVLRATGTDDLILRASFADVLAQTMLPMSHVLWGSVWLGIATKALLTATRFMQAAARSSGDLPAAAVRLADISATHQQLTSLVRDGAAWLDSCPPDDLSTPRAVVAMNNLKISASSLAVDVVGNALLVTGLAGYREDGEFSLGRLLRDVYGGAVMVSNDRIAVNTAHLLLAVRDA